MKIAIAGVGDFARYLIDEFVKSDHEIVTLSRSRKAFLDDYHNVEQRVTDYSVNDLKGHLSDCDAVLSALAGPEEIFLQNHLALLKACEESPKCKKYFPGEWTVNLVDHWDQPIYRKAGRKQLLDALHAQKEIKWTMFSLGWFMDYLVPSSQRFLKDIGRGWVLDFENKIMDIYGTGSQKITLTSARDVARAALASLERDDDWEEFTCIAGETISYSDLYKLLHHRDPSWRPRKVLLSEIIETIVQSSSADPEAPTGVSYATLPLMGFAGCNELPKEVVQRHRDKFFSQVRFRSIGDFLQDAAAGTENIP